MINKTIPMFKVNMAPGTADAVTKVLESGMIGEGPKVIEFTEALKDLFKHPHVVALNSCTSALTLALRLGNIGPNNTVLSSPFTMVATNCAIAASGADIRWCSVDKRTYCMDLARAANIIKHEHISAVIITLVGGMVPHGLEEFIEVCSREGTYLIFDAAHALTTTYKGIHISHWADATCFSFQSIKHLTTGDGGAIAIKRLGDYMRAQKLKWFGLTREVPEGKTRLEHQMTYQMSEWGYKYHMNDISASIGLANWDVALRAIKKSQDNADFYNSFKSPLDGPEVPKGCNPSWWVYPVWSIDPGRLVEDLAKYNIVATQMWPMNNIHDCFPNDEENQVSITNGENRIFSINPWGAGIKGGPVFIPNGFWLTKEDRMHIAKSLCIIKKSLERKK